MNSFGPQSFTTAIRGLVPNHYKFNKEAITLVTSLIYEINNDFVNACLQNSVNVKDISVKHVRDSIKNIIPGDLRKYAFAEADSEIMKYNSGLIDYKVPDIQKEKEIVLDTRGLRKCLEHITQAVNRNLRLSKNSKLLVSIIQKLALQMAEITVKTIGDKPEMSLEDTRNVVNSLLGEDMFEHSEGHADKNLEWYADDNLDFTIKPIIAKAEETVLDEEHYFLRKCIQKALKSRYSTPMSTEIIQSFVEILKKLINIIFEEIKFVFQNGIDDVPNDSISEEHVRQALRTFLPEPLFKLSLCNAEANLLNYRCGILKYDYVRKEGKEEQVDASIKPDFRKGVKYIMKMATCPYSNGFLPSMNDALNDVCSSIINKCCKSAKGNNNILSENDIIIAVNDILPTQLREHAKARIAHIQIELGQSCTQLAEHVSSNVMEPSTVKHKEPNICLDETKNDSAAKEQASSSHSEVPFPSKPQNGSFVNDNQMTPKPGSDTNGENAVHGKTPELDDSNCAVKISGMSGFESNKLDTSGVSNEPELKESNNNSLQKAVDSIPIAQSGYQAKEREDLEEKCAQVETKPSNSEVRETISSIFSLIENTCASQHEYVMLDIPKNIYWLDVRPYEI